MSTPSSSVVRTRIVGAVIACAMVVAGLLVAGHDPAGAIDPADVDTVYIAVGTNFPDALMGATLAASTNSPMLGVAPGSIPAETERELDRLTQNRTSLLDTIVILGGTAAVSEAVANQLGAWATDVQRISGTSRYGTFEEISKALPGRVDEAANADTLDGKDSSAFLGATDKAVDSDTLDGMDSADFLGATDKAADSDMLDGKDSSAFLGATDKAADSDTLDGLDSSTFQDLSAIATKGSTTLTVGVALSKDVFDDSITVPAGTTAVVTIQVTGQFDTCTNSNTSVTCRLKIELGGAALSPQSSLGFFIARPNDSVTKTFAVTGASGVLGPGTYPINIDMRVSSGTGTFTLSAMTMVATVHLVS